VPELVGLEGDEGIKKKKKRIEVMEQCLDRGRWVRRERLQTLQRSLVTPYASIKKCQKKLGLGKGVNAYLRRVCVRLL